jgi:hypothetical protein
MYGGVNDSSIHSQLRHYMEVNDQLHILIALHLRKEPDTHSREGWVVPRVGTRW